jgi:hypothetical protein
VNPSAILILQPQFNQGLFLTLCKDMLGESPARSADAEGLRGLSHLIAVLRDFSGKPETDVYNLLQFGCLMAADERDTPLLLEALSGMQFALTDTVIRGVHAIVVSGTLSQWIQAVSKGCRKEQTTAVRYCFDKIYMCFCQQGLASVFNCVKHDLPDHTFYLTEEKRR